MPRRRTRRRRSGAIARRTSARSTTSASGPPNGGADARGKYRSDDLMPDLFAGPYVFLEPDFAFVLDDGHRAVGYVIGTPDNAAFARAYRARWIPRLAGRYPVPPEPPA